jgi:hypothetical protein
VTDFQSMLYAREDVAIRSVSVASSTVVSDHLTVTYIVQSGWELDEYAFWIDSHKNAYPSKKNGSPKWNKVPFRGHGLAGSCR